MIRNDYVSNSSSCSFIVNELESCDIDELKGMLDIKSKDVNPRKVSSITFISKNGFSDDAIEPYYDICDPDYNWECDTDIRTSICFSIEYCDDLTHADKETGILNYFHYKDIIFNGKLLQETNGIMIDLGDICDISYEDFMNAVNEFKENGFHITASDESHYSLVDNGLFDIGK